MVKTGKPRFLAATNGSFLAIIRRMTTNARRFQFDILPVGCDYGPRMGAAPSRSYLQADCLTSLAARNQGLRI